MNSPQPDLSRFGSADIADALGKLGLDGYLPGLDSVSPVASQAGFKMVGRAHTARFVKIGEAGEAVEAHYVDVAPRDSVIVVETPEGSINAVWGGLLLTRARYLGCKGIVINGLCRDLNEQRANEFPVYTRKGSTSCLGAGGLSKLGYGLKCVEHGETITVKCSEEVKVDIAPGDWMVGDADGVVRIPQNSVLEVMRIANELMDVEGRCQKDLSQGTGLKESFAKWR